MIKKGFTKSNKQIYQCKTCFAKFTYDSNTITMYSKLEISQEQICIITSADRDGHEIFKAVGYAKPTLNSIHENFGECCIKNLLCMQMG